MIYAVGPDGTRTGDYYDRPRDEQALPPGGGPMNLGAFFEFRLWDPEHRGQSK